MWVGVPRDVLRNVASATRGPRSTVRGWYEGWVAVEINLADLFECVADHVPERIAIASGDRRETYRELDARSNAVAHALVDLGVRPGDHVGLMMRERAEHLESMLACFKCRAVPINVNYRYVEDELGYLFDDADLVGVIASSEFGERVAAAGRGLAWRIRVGADRGTSSRDGGHDYEQLLTAASTTRLHAERSTEDHYVLYTGGTTGRPKGVVWRQADIFFAALGGGNPGGPPIARPEEIGPNAVRNRAQRVGAFLPEGDPGPDHFVSLALGPLMHASGQWSALGTLLGGGTVVLYPDAHMDLDRVLELVERERVVALNLVGDASGRPMVDAVRRAAGARDTASLRLLGSGGSALSAEVKESLMTELPSVLAIVEGIGSSESPAQGVSVTTRGGTAARSLTFAAKPATRVVDDDLRTIAAGSGAVGRLATKGFVPLGYYKDPERTAATFVEIDGDRWALPGDMATVEADGSVRLLGRGSLCINTGGEKVYPEEVESALRTHPAIADAVVLGVPDPTWGEAVAAIVAPATGHAPPSLEDVRAHCRGRVAGYKAPRALHIVDAVSRLPTGKPDYAWAHEVLGRSG